MFRCTVCKKLYTTEIQYCDCGNDEFVYVVDSVTDEKISNSKVKNNDFISLFVFILCTGLAFGVLFLYNPVKSHKTSKPKLEVSSSVQTPQIPSIDEIWDDTPAYGAVVGSSNDIDIYKKSLQNLLNSNIQPKQYNGNGRCEIEFHVTDNGKLVNRKMYKKEGDREFNNIILNMLKSTTKHKVPPADYFGERIRGEVIVQDGIIKLYIK